jgi:hypothetical protein
MAAIVKANSSLTAGSLAVLKRTFSTSREGRLSYLAEYVCLSNFARNHAGKFVTGAIPPTPLPAIVSQLQIKDNPTLYDLQTETINGLTYFRATYSAVGSGEGSFTVTESSDQRSFQGSKSKIITTGTSGFQTENPVIDNLSFDYISTSVTVSSQNSTLPQARSGSVGKKFNIRITRTFAIGGGTITGGYVGTVGSTIESTSSTRNSDGTYTFSRTSTGIYILGGPDFDFAIVT